VKAATVVAYGSSEVVQIRECRSPFPNDDEVLLPLRAGRDNPLIGDDAGSPSAFRLLYGGLRKPKALRSATLGEIEAVWQERHCVQPGDAVFGRCSGACRSMHAQPSRDWRTKPPGASFEQAAAVPVAGLTALQGLRDFGRVGRGDNRLIKRRGRRRWTFAVQIAKSSAPKLRGSAALGIWSSCVRSEPIIRRLPRAKISPRASETTTCCSIASSPRLDEYPRHPAGPTAFCVIVGAPKHLSTVGLLKYLVVPKLLSPVRWAAFVTFITKMNERDLPAMADLMNERRGYTGYRLCYPLSETARAIAYVTGGHAEEKSS